MTRPMSSGSRAFDNKMEKAHHFEAKSPPPPKSSGAADHFAPHSLSSCATGFLQDHVCAMDGNIRSISVKKVDAVWLRASLSIHRIPFVISIPTRRTDTLHSTIFYPILSFTLLSHPALPCSILPRRLISCPVLSCPVLSCPVPPCPALSYPALPCLALPCPASNLKRYCELIIVFN